MAGHTLFPSITPTRPDVEAPTVEELLEGDYQAAVTAVTAGEVDDRLAELAEREERSTVQEAIAERRAQLGESETAEPEGEPDQQAAAND